MNMNHLYINNISLKLYLSFLKQSYSLLLPIKTMYFKFTFGIINLSKLELKPLNRRFDSCLNTFPMGFETFPTF